MIVSDAQREANRRNAQLSTGPTTAAGKEASSRNAVRHGLTAERPVDAAEAAEHAARVAAAEAAEHAARVAAAEAAEHAARVASFRTLFEPMDEWQGWLVEELAGATLRLTRIARAEVALRADAAWRAEHLWDEDRQFDAERVGATLARRPARAVADLRRTPHGCEWLIARWQVLAVAAVADAWTPAQAGLARDLLGMPAEFRPDPADADADAAQFPDPARLARSQIDQLLAHMAVVDAADEAARERAIAGLADAPTRELANIRRYERAALRRLEWVKDQMERVGLRPQPQSQPAAPRAVAPTIQSASPTPDPAPPRVGGETKPQDAPPVAPAAPEARPKRPDLDKFRRRNRRSA